MIRNNMSKKSNTISKNYLEYIPKHTDGLQFDIEENGNVTLYQENKGFFNKIAQTFFKKPKVSQIHLDKMGNFIWPLIDGKRNLFQIADEVKNHFGDEAEPLYNRLVQYVNTLESYGFIVLTDNKDSADC